MNRLPKKLALISGLLCLSILFVLALFLFMARDSNYQAAQYAEQSNGFALLAEQYSPERMKYSEFYEVSLQNIVLALQHSPHNSTLWVRLAHVLKKQKSVRRNDIEHALNVAIALTPAWKADIEKQKEYLLSEREELEQGDL